MRTNALNVQNNNNKVNFSGTQKAAKEGVTFVNDKLFHKLKNANGVHQRAILGVTAFATQPFIDYYNPRADEKTRKYSVLKTVVKLGVGMGVGCLVRQGCIIGANKLVTEHADWLIKTAKDSKVKQKLTETLKRPLNPGEKFVGEDFASNLGTALGIVGVVVADVLIDMPLAKWCIEKSAVKMGLSKPQGEGK